MVAVLSRSDIDAKQAPPEEPSLEARRRLEEAIAELRRDSHRIQELLVEAPRRDSRRFQAEMETSRRRLTGRPDLQEAIAEMRRDSRRFQAEMEALRLRMAAPFDAMVREQKEWIRSWRTDPYRALLDPRSTPKRRRAAARRIAAALPPFAFKNPVIRKALRGVPAAERDRWLRQLFADALVDAGKEAGTPQRRIRLGQRWVKNRRGRVLEHVAPLELDWADARRWLLQRAWRMTERVILGEDADSGRSLRRLSHRDRKTLGEDHQGVEGMSEYRPTPPTTLGTSRLSKRERQLWEIFRAGGSTADATARLKVVPETIRSLRFRLRNKGLKV